MNMSGGCEMDVGGEGQIFKHVCNKLESSCGQPDSGYARLA